MRQNHIVTTATLIALFFTANLNAQEKSKDREPIAHYSGKVIDSDGQLIAGATVFSSLMFSFGELKDVESVGKTDADGKFRIPIFAKTSHSIFVYSKGHAIAVKRFGSRDAIEDSEGNVFELGKPETITVSIVGADSSPAEIESARVGIIASGKRGFMLSPFKNVPIPVRVEQDKFTLDWLPPDSKAQIEVKCKGHVAQSVYVNEETATESKAKLLENALLEGFVKSGDAGIGSSTIIANVTESRLDDSWCPVGKRVIIKSSEDGRYQLGLIEGAVTITCYDARTNTQKRVNLELKANETLTHNIEFDRLVRVYGRVVDEKGHGIEGIRISSRDVVTNMNGEYEFEAAPLRQIRISVEDIPEGFCEQEGSYRIVPPRKAGEPSSPYRVIPQVGEESHAVADIVLKYASPVRGIVVDSSGMPVEGVSVSSGWEMRSGRMIRNGGKSTTTDEQGKFVIGNSPKVDVAIYATADDMATPKTLIVKEDDKREEVRMEISSDGIMNLRGKISSADGQPVENANVVVLRRGGFPWSDRYGDISGAAMGECKSSKDGSFEFPIPLYRCEYYSVKVFAPGYVGRKVKSLEIPETGDPTGLADFRLSPLRSVRGVVVDSKGDPVVGARVWSHHFVDAKAFPGRKRVDHRNHEGSSAETDAEGKFALTGVHDEATFAFASKDGWGMIGTPIGPGASEITLTLGRDGELSKGLKMASLSEETRRDAVNRLVDFKTKDGRKITRYERNEVLNMLLEIDRDRLEGMIDEMDWGYGKAQLHAALGHTEEALETALAYENPKFRLQTLTACADRMQDKEQRAVLLNEAAFQLANLPDAATKIGMSSSLIDNLLDVGEKESAEALARSIEPMVAAVNAKNPRSEFTRAWFAKSLVRIDYEAAWELVKDTVDSDILSGSGGFQRHAGNMAHEIAAESPDRAIGLLRKIPSHQQGRYLPRVACRMANVDPDRAVELLSSGKDSSSHYKTNGQATMAFILKDSRPELSKQLIKEAFESLFKQFPKSDHRIGKILNMLRYESHLGGSSENFWKVVEQLSDPNGRVSYSSNSDVELLRKSELALLLGIFDREPKTRERICETLFAKYSDPGDDKIFSRSRENAIAFVAMAMHDPLRAVETVEKFNELTPENRRNAIPQPWAVVGGVLARTGDERIDYMADDFLFTWILGKED